MSSKSRWLSTLIGASLACAAPAQTLELLSTDAAGMPANGSWGNDVRGPAVSADGRFVAFYTNVAMTPGGAGVFVRDRATGTVVCASVPTGGGSGKPASAPAISDDGRFVAFLSSNNALVIGDTNGVLDAFVHDTAAVTTTRVSVSSTGAQANRPSQLLSMSADGRFVAFDSFASNLVTNDANGDTLDVFVHDRASGATELVSVPSAGPNGPGRSRRPYVSRDGRYVVFESDNDLDPSLLGPTPAIFVRDRANATTRRVSLDRLGAPISGRFGASDSEFYSAGGISGDGRFVVYRDNLQTASHLLRRDLASNAVEVVSVTPSGVPPGWLGGGQLSHDGRFVVFHCFAPLTPDDVNVDEDAYIRDMQLGVTRRISIELPGHLSTWGSNSGNASISADACTVVFESNSNELVAGDTNYAWDVFAWDASEASPSFYCAPGASLLGCVATLATNGTPSSTAGSGFVITASHTDGQTNSMLIYGISGRAELPFGQSTMCVAAPRQRTINQSTGGNPGLCNGAASIDWNAFVAANPGALGAPFASQTPTFAQVWIRDSQSPTHAALSNAVEFYACP